jgi:hypothetical protein
VILGRFAAVAVLAGTLLGCRGAPPPSGAPEAGGGGGARDARGEGGGDSNAAQLSAEGAAPAPDDSLLPPTGDDAAVRARHLLEAVAKDDPAFAGDILFPRDGWLATRDAVDAGKEWDRLVAEPFRRAVHALSHRAGIERAQAVSLELGHVMVQTTPRKHGWKKALWTLHGSRLTFVLDGHTRTLPIHELTAWRGAWYVTRLR